MSMYPEDMGLISKETCGDVIRSPPCSLLLDINIRVLQFNSCFCNETRKEKQGRAVSKFALGERQFKRRNSKDYQCKHTSPKKKEIEITELEIMVSAYNWTFWRKVLMHMYYFRQFLASMKATVWSPGGNRN
jgi:hypothetical protein